MRNDSKKTNLRRRNAQKEDDDTVLAPQEAKMVRQGMKQIKEGRFSSKKTKNPAR